MTMNRKLLTAAGLAACALAYFVFATSIGSSTIPLANSRPETVGASTDPAEAVMPAPLGGDGALATPSSTQARAPTELERIARYGYFDALIHVEDELEYLKRDPVSRVLTPTSEEDAKWMAAQGYPRRQDIEAGDLNALLAERDNAHPVQQTDRIEYLTNVVVAKLYRANDPRWRDYAGEAFGSFSTMLQLADMRDQMDAGVRPDHRKLLGLLVDAQLMGEVDAVGLFERAGSLPMVDALDYAGQLQARARLIDHLNRRAVRRGQKPWGFTIRPPAPWNDAYRD